MKAILLFDTDNPDDRERFNRASRADDLWLGIESALDSIRHYQKHVDPDSINGAKATIVAIRDGLSECLQDAGIIR